MTTKTKYQILFAISLALTIFILLYANGNLIIFEDGSFVFGQTGQGADGWQIVERWATGCIPFNLCK